MRSKLGLIAATRVLAREHPRMRINACCPGYCDTDRWDRWEATKTEKTWEQQEMRWEIYVEMV